MTEEGGGGGLCFGGRVSRSWLCAWLGGGGVHGTPSQIVVSFMTVWCCVRVREKGEKGQRQAGRTRPSNTSGAGVADRFLLNYVALPRCPPTN